MKFKKILQIFIKKLRPKKGVFWIVLCLFSELLWALPKQNLQNFNIDSGSADVSLIEFAKQANFTIIFPYEKVQSRRSNSLKGSFTIEQGIAKLLEGTGLVASFETDGVVTIKRISIRDTVIEDKSLFQELVDLFAGKGDDLVIFPEEPLLMELIEVRGIRSSMDWALDQ